MRTNSVVCADENMKTRKAGAIWAVSSVGGTFRAVCSIDGSFYQVYGMQY